MSRDWKTIGKTSMIGLLGIPIGLGILGGRHVYKFVKNYSAALSHYRAAELMPYDVPPDGSVGIDDIAKGEGLTTFTEKSAFRTVAGENLFGKDKFTTIDSQGNTTVLHDIYSSEFGGKYTVPVEIPSSVWAGSLPKGHQVWLPDINGDGKFSPFADYRNDKSAIMADTRSQTKAMRNQGMLR